MHTNPNIWFCFCILFICKVIMLHVQYLGNCYFTKGIMPSRIARFAYVRYVNILHEKCLSIFFWRARVRPLLLVRARNSKRQRAPTTRPGGREIEGDGLKGPSPTFRREGEVAETSGVERESYSSERAARLVWVRVACQGTLGRKKRRKTNDI